MPADLDDVDGYKNMQELLGKLDAALHVAPRTKGTAAAASDGSSAKASSGGPRGTIAEPLVCCPASNVIADTCQLRQVAGILSDESNCGLTRCIGSPFA
jgi:hypothetical protein